MAAGCHGEYLPRGCSEEPAVLEVLFDDDICDCVKDEFDVLCVCGTGHVAVDFLHVLSHVEIKELGLDVISCVFKCVGTCGGRGEIRCRHLCWGGDARGRGTWGRLGLVFGIQPRSLPPSWVLTAATNSVLKEAVLPCFHPPDGTSHAGLAPGLLPAPGTAPSVMEPVKGSPQGDQTHSPS